MQVLVLGIGNSLMSDDGFGVRVVEELQRRYRFPENVTVLDGGTLGLDLLPHLEGADRLLIIDAIDMREKPGEIFRLEGEEVPRAFASKLSVHQMGVQDLLAVAELQGYCPPELVVWGVQPDSIEMNMELSQAVAPALPRIVKAVVEELSAWGCPPEELAA
ncbi:hydrogenase maturation protease [Geothermobacter ehrlichii]|uniref:Hydrogenase maturation protease n=1 Tax=Geothermobacter ehrlichii TaxID=213224 RepID=A0A5D3WK53_9BACT|nr:HyaD/HybD family hydrogenase maturation endopeptidase [Geothermobacter ehrlichii]TYO99342.1 hydrogenase maturation protease [Geothermobacter ehrlichii]